MPRQKKDNEPLNIRLDKALAEQLAAYCRDTGATKTAVVEKALTIFFEDYQKTQDLLEAAKRSER